MANKFPDLSNLVRDLNGSTSVTRLSRVALYTIDPNGLVGNLTNAGMASLSDSPLIGNSMRINDESALARAAGGHAFFIGIKQALDEIVSSGTDYYTLSYVPNNPNWNDKFRRIHIDVAGIPEGTKSWSTLWSAFLGWTEYDQRKVLYREGYVARKATTVSSPMDPHPNTVSLVGSAQPMTLQTAMGFGLPTPDRLRFTVAVTPSLKTRGIKRAAPLPKDDFMLSVFREMPFRVYQLHSVIDPKQLHFEPTDTGTYNAEVRIVALCYRDDGVEANSIATTRHIEVTKDELATMMATGLTFDQNLAIPSSGNFFLRIGLEELSTQAIGVIEVPLEWVKLRQPTTSSHPDQ